TTPHLYALSLHDALPIFANEVALEHPCCLVPDLAAAELGVDGKAAELRNTASVVDALEVHRPGPFAVDLDDEDAELLGLCLRARSEEHTSELQSLRHLVC